MIEIIPTIIARNFQEIKDKISRVEPYVNWVQLDIMDGQFVNNATWNEPADLKNLKTKLNLEVHLMVKEPEKTVDDWLNSGVKRIIIHFEASQQIKEVIGKIKKAGLGVGLAINPNTPIEVVKPYIPDLDLILVMTVEPGQGGQKFLDDTLVKIKKLREAYPDVKIEVDGGINPETASGVIKAGANLLVSGTAVFNSPDIGEIINQLKRA